ncbi:MAG: hypothetical protein Q9175_007689 [Cornicularia normoerica]
MSDGLPTTKAAWQRSARRNGIGHTLALTAGTNWVSGSKFQFEHFLRLRVLYTEERSPQKLAECPEFSEERMDLMARCLQRDADAAFLENFLKDRTRLRSHWNPENARKSGKFAIALELLALIAKRGVDLMNDSEDISDHKIDWSPPKTRSMTQSNAHYHARPFEETPTKLPSRPPTWLPPQHWLDPPSTNEDSDDLGMSNLSIMSPEEKFSPPDSDRRRAQDSHERSEFFPGDEQTVNAALVALMMALSWLLGRTGRVHHDRAKFSIPNDSETCLYSACVDGLVMHFDRDKYSGFMEAKRDFRGQNSSVRRQIAAQMAAFIYELDSGLIDQETEEQTEKVPKGKGKNAKAQEKKSKNKDGGNEEMLNRFRKWMVSLDGHYAYINIATYDRQYVKFLSGSQPSAADDAFMDMVEYGRFDLRVWRDSGEDVGLGSFLKHVGALMLGTASP